MKREIINIDEDLCNGCGKCIPNCHEGALQIIDGKARLISDLMCDGLGACLGHCPLDAMKIEYREADEYNEVEVIKLMIPKGENTVLAHLKHLKDHGEFDFLKQAVGYLNGVKATLPFSFDKIRSEVHSYTPSNKGKCPGSMQQSFEPSTAIMSNNTEVSNFNMKAASPIVAVNKSETALKQWPVQLHLLNPRASFCNNADFVLCADCVPFAYPDFHSTFLKDKVLGIACPKLDSSQEVYLQKLISLIDDAKIKSLHVVTMEVPCCGGLLALAKRACSESVRSIELTSTVVSIRGDVV